MNNKRGVSVIVGYVLLIIIAVGLAGFVFAYLKVFIPKDKVECKTDVHLTLSAYQCKTNQLTLTLQNKGLFTIDGAYVRIGPPDRKVKSLINKEQILFEDSGLKPGETRTENYTSSEIIPGDLEVEIQPAVFDGAELAICERAVITQPITCLDINVI